MKTSIINGSEVSRLSVAIQNDSFKVGDEIFLVEARGSDKGCSEDMLRLKLASKDPKQLDFVLDTESIYGDKFRYTYSQNRQVKLD